MINVWIDYYEKGDSVHVFVNGHALCRGSSSIEIGRKLAKDAGQDYISITTHFKDGSRSQRLHHAL